LLGDLIVGFNIIFCFLRKQTKFIKRIVGIPTYKPYAGNVSITDCSFDNTEDVCDATTAETKAKED
jgi:hypothetical protein